MKMSTDMNWLSKMAAEEDKQDVSVGRQVIAHKCAPEVCADGGKHQWDGEPITMGYIDSVTCSKCGAIAAEVDQWTAP